LERVREEIEFLNVSPQAVMPEPIQRRVMAPARQLAMWPELQVRALFLNQSA
jgi:hypothetical protein